MLRECALKFGCALSFDSVSGMASRLHYARTSFVCTMFAASRVDSVKVERVIAPSFVEFHHGFQNHSSTAAFTNQPSARNFDPRDCHFTVNRLAYRGCHQSNGLENSHQL